MARQIHNCGDHASLCVEILNQLREQAKADRVDYDRVACSLGCLRSTVADVARLNQSSWLRP